jgi:hypothetical protein
MKSSVADHRAVALAACASAVPLLREAGLNDVADQLAEITSLALADDDEAALSMSRKLPQSDIADFWDPLDWDLEADSQLERKALVTAYYWATWKALVNWRVAKSYDFEREAVDRRPHSLENVAKELLAQQKGRHERDAQPFIAADGSAAR